MIIIIRCWFVNSSEWIDNIPIVKKNRIRKVLKPDGIRPGLIMYEEWALLVNEIEYEEINKYITDGDYDAEIKILNF